MLAVLILLQEAAARMRSGRLSVHAGVRAA